MAAFLGASARTVTELRGAVLALKAVDRTVRNEINRTTRAEGGTIWKDEIAGRLGGMPRVDQLVLGGPRYKAGNPFSVSSATRTRALSGGLVPTARAKGFEFGTDNREKTSTYTRRNRDGSGSHTVTRRTTRHLPNRAPNGRVIWPAAAATGPRLTSLWVQTIVRIIHDALEGK